MSRNDRRGEGSHTPPSPRHPLLPVEERGETDREVLALTGLDDAVDLAVGRFVDVRPQKAEEFARRLTLEILDHFSPPSCVTGTTVEVVYRNNNLTNCDNRHI